MSRSWFTCSESFPADSIGGHEAIKAFSSVLPELSFCPTGGVDLTSAKHYLSLNSVICVGGSWLIDQDALADGDYELITTVAKKSILEIESS